MSGHFQRTFLIHSSIHECWVGSTSKILGIMLLCTLGGDIQHADFSESRVSSVLDGMKASN